MNILGTGLSGLLGTSVVDLLKDDFSFTNLSLETGVDITDTVSLSKAFEASDAPWVFHFAAVTDVDASEKEKALKEKSLTWRVNVDATETIVSLCRRLGKHLLYISTDYVFAGDKERYVETDLPDPAGFYAQTKYEGEKRVMSLGELGLIIRMANPYGPKESGKKDFVHKIADELRHGAPIKTPADQTFVPTFIPDIAMAIGLLVGKNAYGIYHVVGDEALSPYEAALEVARTIGASEALVQKTQFALYFDKRAPRPFHVALSNDKIKKLGLNVTSFKHGLEIIYSNKDKNI